MKQFQRFVFALCTVFILLSCKGDKYDIDQPASTELFSVQKKITSDPLPISSSEFNFPLQIIVKDSLLMVLDRFEKNDTTYIFRIFDRMNGKILSSFGTIGRGPDEFLFPALLDRMPGERSRIGVYNPRLFRFSELSIDSILTQSNGFTLKTYKELPTQFSKVVKLHQNLILGTGFFEEGRYALADPTGNTVSVAVKYPFYEQLDQSNRALGMAYQSTLRLHPKQNLIASVSSSSANLDILSVEDQKIEIKKQIHTYPPIFEDASSNNRLDVNFSSENLWGYQDVDVTDSHIYVLYSGKKRGDDFFRFGNKLLVFDWFGKPVSSYILDREVNNIGVDDEGESLYGIAKNGGEKFQIVRFNLDPLE